MSNLTPNLRHIKVQPKYLILDPNNPRLITRDEDRHPEDDALSRLGTTTQKMSDGRFKIDDLVNSIKQNGWLPVDAIFVKKLESESKYYLVLEGNRRVTAITKLLDDDSDISAELKASISEIDVMEIIDDIPPDELNNKITYLLGVRHHGALKKWSPFAQARNIYKRYLEITNTEADSFAWDEDKGNLVADALSISTDHVRDRLKVFRAMEQLSKHPDIAESDGGMKDRYYSVCAEVLLTKDNALKDYIQRSDTDFTLDDESMLRMNNLCHFDKKGREGAPINNPHEWRKLSAILKDDDSAKKVQMLDRVTQEKVKPSVVWAERASELQTLRWDRWLFKVNTIIKRITIGDDLDSSAAMAAISKLSQVLDKLDEIDNA